jgi:hypothetical protein
MMLRLSALILVGTTVATSASAQPEDNRNQISGGAQWALPYSGPDDKPGVQLSWRRWLSPRLGIGTDLRVWRSTTTDEFGPRRQETRERSSYGFGVAVLGRESIGRLSLIGGAGPGFFVDRAVHEGRIGDLRDAGSSTQQSIGLHMLAEVEVRAVRSLSLFAGLRIELRDVRTFESSSGYPTTGVRVAF